MSIREFFETRYSIPGWTVFIWMVGTAFPAVSHWLTSFDDSMIPLGLTLIPIFIGNPLGYYVSQLWYLFVVNNWFDSNVYGSLEENKKREYIKVLENYNLPISDKYVTVEIIDYFLNTSGDENNINYVNQRWDIYNMMGATIISIILGWTLGIGFARYKKIELGLTFPLFGFNAVEIIFAIAGIILIFLLLKNGIPVSRKEHEHMLSVVIHNHIRKHEYELTDLFPKHYFENACARTRI
jgi:hypothetical protein